jgi:hypothetical protein
MVSIDAYVDMGLEVSTSADAAPGVFALAGAIGMLAIGAVKALAGELWVWDARTDNYTGPYSAEDAAQLADDLNQMVFRNTTPVLAEMGGAHAEGPFYARSQADKERQDAEEAADGRAIRAMKMRRRMEGR